MLNAEPVYLSERGVYVTSGQIVTPRKTYSMRHVMSAWTEIDKQSGRPEPWVYLLLGGCLFLFVGLAVWLNSLRSIDASTVLTGFIGAGIAVALGAAFVVCIIRAMTKAPLWRVCVATGGRDLTIWIGQDGDFADRLAAAVERALPRQDQP